MLNTLRQSPVSLTVGKPASKSLAPLVRTREGNLIRTARSLSGKPSAWSKTLSRKASACSCCPRRSPNSKWNERLQTDESGSRMIDPVDMPPKIIN